MICRHSRSGIRYLGRQGFSEIAFLIPFNRLEASFPPTLPAIKMKTPAHRIENAITLIGKFSSWSMAVLLGAIVIQVLLRYAFGITNTFREDSLWYLFSATLVLGLSYDDS